MGTMGPKRSYRKTPERRRVSFLPRLARAQDPVLVSRTIVGYAKHYFMSYEYGFAKSSAFVISLTVL